jgi:hypothetical protein
MPRSERPHTLRASAFRLVLCAASVLTSAWAKEQKPKPAKNRTLGHWSIAKCDFAERKPSPSGMIPKKACAREDLGRHDLCALLAKFPPQLPADAMEKARLHPERRMALDAHVTSKEGGRMVEVGTMTGALAKHLIRAFKPKELTVMDVDGWAIGQCNGRVKQVAREVGANTSVTCILGDSKRSLQSLEDDAYDLIYIDGAHDYHGVCGDVSVPPSASCSPTKTMSPSYACRPRLRVQRSRLVASWPSTTTTSLSGASWRRRGDGVYTASSTPSTSS